MFRRAFIFLVPVALIVAAVGMMVGGGGDPLEARIVEVEDLADHKAVTIEFARTEIPANFYEDHQVRARVGGRWQRSLPFPELEDDRALLSRARVQRVVFELPVRSEAVRLAIGYRIGGSPYCRAYGFLSRHGMMRRFPKTSRAVLRLVPRKPRLHCQVVEFEIPPAFDSEKR